MIRYATIQDARLAVKQWGGDPISLVHIGNHATSVFLFKNHQGEDQILRMSDPTFRTLPETLAELAFINTLAADGVSVSAAIPTSGDALLHEQQGNNGAFVCSSIEFADGIAVDESSPYWNDTFFKEWGRNLATIHNSSERYKTRQGGPLRWHWKNELLFRNAEKLLPSDDRCSREEMRSIFAECDKLNKCPIEFGLIHADHAPQNFRYSAERNQITAFDFGNCCYHWFIADLAISLSTVRRKENRNSIKASLLDGYSSARPLPFEYEKLIDLFIRMRVVYFYLSRLHMWTNPTAQQRQDLLLFKERVHSKIGWG